MVSGGDVGVALKDSPGAQALLTFVASTDAAKIWASSGGYLSPNKSLPFSAYPDAVSRSIAQSLIASGDNFRFDMSDQAPAAFGGTKGAGRVEGPPGLPRQAVRRRGHAGQAGSPTPPRRTGAESDG